MRRNNYHRIVVRYIVCFWLVWILPGGGADDADTSGATSLSELLQSGNLGDTRMAYFHLPPTAAAATKETTTTHPPHVVLLHGAAFSKETWQEAGIFELFRTEYPALAVTALDVPVSSDHGVLRRVLEDLVTSGLAEALPVAALVTPSASGRAVTSWIQDRTSEGLEDSVRLWVPVAAGSVGSCTPGDLETLTVAILAIFGNRDSSGRSTTARLEAYANATSLELPGGHPVYLESPVEFVRAVGEATLALRPRHPFPEEEAEQASTVEPWASSSARAGKRTLTAVAGSTVAATLVALWWWQFRLF